MRILVSGSSGLIGSALVESFGEAGHEVTRLVRSVSQTRRPEVQWDPAGKRVQPDALEGFDAVVHLAGENIAKARWTPEQKARIRDSRVQGTEFLSRTLSRLSRPPKVLANASAVGYYGNRGAEELDEASPPGEGFLADVCRQWESATQPAAEAGIRVVLLRFGVVLASGGGALAMMLPIFRWGLGGRLGSGNQYVSWIALDDVVGAIGHVLATETLGGPVNLVAPRPVTNREFTRTLAQVLRRPAWLPAPAFVLRTALGEMAEQLLLSGTRALPRRLLQSGYQFRHAELEAALRHVLSGPA